MYSESKPKYPLIDESVEELHAASGRTLDGINLEAAAKGELSSEDLQATPQTLRAQAAIARQAGFAELAANFERAAELTAVPNEELLTMYEMLRPGRSTLHELTELASRLETQYNAPVNAHFVREATAIYQLRGLLKRTR